MPFRQLPQSNAQRIKALDAAWLKGSTTTDALRLISLAHMAALQESDPTSLRRVFKKEVAEAGSALSAQVELTEDATAAVAALAQIVSHFIQVFNLGVQRGKWERSDRSFYMLAADRSDVPPLVTFADAKLWAERIIAGEAARMAAGPVGVVAMANPSAAEVSTALSTAQNLHTAQSTAKDVTLAEQEDVSDLVAAVDALIADMWDTIEFALRHAPGPHRRRRAREYGVVYIPRQGEAPDPEDSSSSSEESSTSSEESSDGDDGGGGESSGSSE